jgi:hypothetical protein
MSGEAGNGSEFLSGVANLPGDALLARDKAGLGVGAGDRIGAFSLAAFMETDDASGLDDPWPDSVVDID